MNIKQKKIIRISAICLLVILFVLAGAEIWITRKIEAAIEHAIREQGGVPNRVHVGSISIYPLNRTIRLKHLVFGIDFPAKGIRIDLQITEPYDLQTMFLQLFRTKQIALRAVLGKMLRAVDLYNKFCLRTIEIGNEAIDRLLPLKARTIRSKKTIPKFPLLRRSVFAQCPCPRDVFMFVINRHE